MINVGPSWRRHGRTTEDNRATRKSCCIVVENLPVPLDRRVWREACALRDAGWDVHVICPRSREFAQGFERLDGIGIHRHSLPLEAGGFAGFVLEYCAALFHELRLLTGIWWRRRLDVIQICNPPDLLFLAALPFKLLGARIVYDMHDICPELFAAKFGNKGRLYRIMVGLEWLTARTADHVVAANRSFFDIVRRRDGIPPERMTVVYSVPTRSFLDQLRAARTAKSDGELVIGYVGVMNVQDGVDHFIRALADVRRRSPTLRFRAIAIGDGPTRRDLEALAVELGVHEVLAFTGYLYGQEFLAALVSIDIGVIPDPVNENNDKISMNKVFEYLALGVPMVSYRLSETLQLAGDAVLVAEGGTPADLGQRIHQLCADPDLHSTMAAASRARGAEIPPWERAGEEYVAVFEQLHAKGGQRRERSSSGGSVEIAERS
jgi:glycosyltransferase involved in cell wall biosynthesis